MSFRAIRPHTLRWRPVDGPGLEHVTVRPEGDEILARGVVIGDRGGFPYGVDYTIAMTRDWSVRSLELATTLGMAISMTSNGAGAWTNYDGRALPEFDGCLDVDLAGSAFTNTLPLRRIDWSRTTGPIGLQMVYVPFDTFVPVPDGQLYTALEEGRRFRYEAADRSFSAILPVDRDGFVLDYPGLFQRVKDH